MFEYSKCINRSSDNTMTMRNLPTMIYKTLHRKLKLEHHKPPKRKWTQMFPEIGWMIGWLSFNVIWVVFGQYTWLEHVDLLQLQRIRKLHRFRQLTTTRRM